jgi:hypothetical protein
MKHLESSTQRLKGKEIGHILMIVLECIVFSAPFIIVFAKHLKLIP